jgi:hypothetical protein
MNLTHRQVATLQPAPVQVAEPGVAIAVGMPLQVLQVEQLEGDARPPPLGVDPGAVRGWPLPLPRHLGPPVEPGLQDVVGQGLDLGPVQPGPCRPREHAEIVPSPNPTLWATARWGSPRAHFCRRISRICRMDSRSAAIAPLFPAGADGALDHPAPLLRRPPPSRGQGACSRSPIYVFTILILVFTMTDPGVHVAPIFAFTLE